MRGREAFFVSGIAVLAAVLVQAGPLSPPAGPVGSSYKTLSDIDPGTPLSAVPYGQGAKHVITQPGRYYLTGNEQAAGEHCVMVTVPNVTIDLCGFTMQGLPGSLSAIVDATNASRVTVQNGTIVGWGEYAVGTALGEEWVCRGLTVRGGGLRLGSGAVVEGCTVSGSSWLGVSVGLNSRVARCRISSCLEGGVYAASGSRVESCILSDNSWAGVQGAVGVTVSDCSISFTHTNQGSGDGIFLFKNGIVERCVVQGCDTYGVYSEQGGTIVRGCKVDSNKWDGINVYNSSLVQDNEVHANGEIVGGSGTAVGIRVRGTATRVEANHMVSHHTALKIEGAGNLVVRNSFSANTVHVQGVTGNSVAQIIQSPANGFVNTDPTANINF